MRRAKRTEARPPYPTIRPDDTLHYIERGDLGVILTNGSNRYRVGTLVAQAATYRLYFCDDEITGRQYLLQVASEASHNGRLDRAAFILRMLKQASNDIESHPSQPSGKAFNYDRLFPLLVDNFVSEKQGGRRIIILAFKDVDDIATLVPLSNLAVKDRLRIDLRTSAWIMGRLLKLLTLVHGQAVTAGMLTGSNILIQPDDHFAVVLDWTSARLHQPEIPSPDRAFDIAQAAQAVFAAIGGEPETGDYPYSADEDLPYIRLLWELACQRQGHSQEAHHQFYQLVDGLFGRTFHPFKTLPI